MSKGLFSEPLSAELVQAIGELCEAITDAIEAALQKGMETDEAAVAAITAVCVYARREYGAAYLHEIAEQIHQMAVKSRTLPSCRAATGEIGASGECLLCNAEQGEACRNRSTAGDQA